MNKLIILLFSIFFVNCGLFEDPDDNIPSGLKNTLEDNLPGQIGEYEDYFFPLRNKLNLKYTTNSNPDYNNSDTLNLQTFPEFLLYLSPDSSNYQSLMFNVENEEFVNYSTEIIDDTTLSSTIVVSSPRHTDYSTYEWNSTIKRYMGVTEVDHNSCEDNEDGCLSVNYIGDFEFDSTSNIIRVEDPFVFKKTIKVIDSLSTSLYSYLDLSDFDTTLVEVCESDGFDCQSYQDFIIYDFKYGVIGEDSAMFWMIDDVENDTLIGELPNHALIDINGDTIRTFIPDESYTLSDGSEIIPIRWEIIRDTVTKPYMDIKEINMLLENHIIDVLTEEMYSYDIMKTNVGWINNGNNINSSDYFIYRNDNDAIYELVYPSYFNYYGGIWDDQNDVFHDNGWTSNSENMDSILLYLPLRDGEIVENEYSEVFIDNGNGRWDLGEEYEDDNGNGIFDEGEFFTDSQPGNSAQYNFKTSYKVIYGDEVTIDSLIVNGIEIIDTTLSDVFKVTKFASMTMVGSGVKYNEEQVYWLAHGLGIVKQQINYSWGDSEMVLGQEWTMSRYHETEASPSMIINNLNELANVFGEEVFIPKKSSGIVKFAPSFRKGF